MKLDCVIVLGPSGEFYPLINSVTQKFKLPFLNTPLLNLTINYLYPNASKIFIFCLKKYLKIVLELTKDYKIPIFIQTTDSYEGMSHILSVAKKLITTSHFILCKGDIYGLESLSEIIDGFINLDADVYAPLSRTSDDGSLICLDALNYLKMYDQEEIPFIKGEKIVLTTEFIFKDFFILKKSIIENLPENFYSFKSNVLQHFIKLKLKIKCMENKIFQIRNMNDYLTQLDFKNKLIGIGKTFSYNLIEESCIIEDKTTIEDSIIGADCIIGHGSIIKRSIIMNGVIIEAYSFIDSSIISSKSHIKGKSRLVNCKIGEEYIFNCPIEAEYDVFSHE